MKITQLKNRFPLIAFVALFLLQLAEIIATFSIGTPSISAWIALIAIGGITVLLAMDRKDYVFFGAIVLFAISKMIVLGDWISILSNGFFSDYYFYYYIYEIPGPLYLTYHSLALFACTITFALLAWMVLSELIPNVRFLGEKRPLIKKILASSLLVETVCILPIITEKIGTILLYVFSSIDSNIYTWLTWLIPLVTVIATFGLSTFVVPKSEDSPIFVKLFSEENDKIVCRPIAAPILSSLLFIFNIVYIVKLNALDSYNFNDLPYFNCILFLTVSILLIVTKKHFPLFVAAGILSLQHLHFVFSTLHNYITYSIKITGFTIAGLLSDLALAVAFAMVALLILKKFILGMQFAKIKESLLERIFLISFLVVAVASFINIIGIFGNNASASDNDSFLFVYFMYPICNAVLMALFVLFFKNGIIRPKIKGIEATATGDPPPATQSDGGFYVSLGKHICLLLFTFGIWQFIWVYKTTKFANLSKQDPEKSPSTSLLLYIFIPFYSIYWTYKTAQRIDKIAQSKGVSSDIATMCLLFMIFIPILAPIFMQEKINQAVRGVKSTHTIAEKSEAEIESIKKYKELLDAGIISQEEFDAKKKQLLGL